MKHEDRWWEDPERLPPGSMAEERAELGAAIRKLQDEINKVWPFSWIQKVTGKLVDWWYGNDEAN